MYLTQSLHCSVQQHPERIAVRWGSKSRTFAELADRVARLAGALQRLGLKRGDCVAMLSLNSERYLEYQMAVPWAGGVLNPCNIRWSPAEILYSLEDSGSTVLLVDEAFKGVVPAFRSKSTTLREFIYCGDGETPEGMHNYEALVAQNAPVADALRRGDDLAGIFYTGGTTGFPKGVMLSHNNLCISALAMRASGVAQTGGTYLHAAPMFHLADMGLASPHWLEGNTHSIIPMFDPVKLLDTIEQHRVTNLCLVPTMMQVLLDHPAMGPQRDLSSLRTVFFGGSAVPDALMQRVLKAIPHAEVFQGFGMTELSPVGTVLPPYYLSEEGRKHGKLGSSGRAAYCTQVRIVDENGAEVPRGTVGEITVRGANVMQGYWKKPELTAAALRDGWMFTGDGGRMDDDGFVTVVDRLKDMIKTGGENVFSAEVENALAKSPAVASCAVIAIPDPHWGEAVHAVVVRVPGKDVSEGELIAHCKELIAGYKAPRSIAFVDALPVSGAGKVLKTKLREPFWQGRERNVG
jgi:acyl-CoA synthetase (AMP-forming)/AMP-acid ligase II